MTHALVDSYGPFFQQGEKIRQGAGESSVAQLRRELLPRELWPLIPYAEFWGISDDAYREELISAAPTRLTQELKSFLSQYESPLVLWLAGPEAQGAPLTPEYLALSALLRVYDYIN